VQTPRGWETHHLIERCRTSDFGTQAIQDTANAINEPEAVHDAVTGLYNARPRLNTLAYEYKLSHPEVSTVRDWVKTLPYEEQRQFCIDAIRDATDRFKVGEQDRVKVEQEIRKLENPTLCPPGVSQAQRRTPSIADVQAGIDRLRDQRSRCFPGDAGR
jgi:hypothetical protein